jgi:tape measure domain-containing protein
MSEQLLVNFVARTERYERDLARARRRSGSEFRGMRRDAEQAASGIERAIGSMGGKLNGLIAGVVAHASLQQAQKLVDSATRITNALKVAGLEGKALEGVYRQLFDAAQENAAPLESLVTLYGRLSLVQKELGVDQAELIQFSKNVSLALRVGGQSSEEASGALLQLSQALGGGTVRAEEFNSVLEGAPTIAQAVAAGLAEAGGSVAKLRNLVVDGKVSSQAFFRAFEAGAVTLESKVASSQMTVAQNFVRLQNVLIDTAGKVDNATGASAKFGTTLTDLAKTIEQFGAVVVRASDSDLGKFVSWLSQGIDKASEFRKIMGGIPGIIEKMGSLNSDMFQGKPIGTGLKEDAIQNRIDQAFDYPAAQKTGRLPAKTTTATPVVPRVSINDYPVQDSPKDGGKIDIKVDLTKYLAPGKDASHISGMSSAFEGKLEKLLAAMPKELAGQIRINSGFRTFERQQQLWQQALQKYGSVAEARKWVAPPGNSQHNKGNAADLGYGSEAARQWAHKNASQFGLQFPLSNEDWHIEDADARAGMMADKTKDLEDRGQAYDDMLMRARTFIAEQGREGQALGMTSNAAARLRYEQEMLNQAQQAGIDLTPRQRQEISQLAQGMATAETSFDALKLKQDQAAEASQFFAQTATDAITGLITGATTAEEALQTVLQSLVKVALQGALMGEGPLAGLFGTTGGVGFFSIFSKMLGFAEGGHVRGPGTGTSDSIPAWLSNGEHVTNARSTAKYGPLLDAINEDRLSPQYLAAGGYVGNAPAVHRPAVQAANSNTAVQQISISAPVTVNGSAGTPDQNSDLAAKMARQMEQTMRGVVADEFRRQSRPGNMLNSRGR